MAAERLAWLQAVCMGCGRLSVHHLGQSRPVEYHDRDILVCTPVHFFSYKIPLKILFDLLKVRYSRVRQYVKLLRTHERTDIGNSLVRRPQEALYAGAPPKQKRTARADLHYDINTSSLTRFSCCSIYSLPQEVPHDTVDVVIPYCDRYGYYPH